MVELAQNSVAVNEVGKRTHFAISPWTRPCFAFTLVTLATFIAPFKIVVNLTSDVSVSFAMRTLTEGEMSKAGR